MPNVNVEFYGIPRVRAGVRLVSLEASNTLELLQRLAEAYPQFGAACLTAGGLRPEYLLNINGREFTRKEDVSLNEGDTVLILSADVGG